MLVKMNMCHLRQSTKRKPASNVVYSNVKEVVEQAQYLFETLWSRSLPADQRIREIEVGVTRYETVVIENPQEIIKEISHLTVNSMEHGCFVLLQVV